MPHFTITINIPDDGLTELVNGYAGPVTNVQAVRDQARQWMSSRFNQLGESAVPYCVSGIAHPAIPESAPFSHVEDDELRAFLTNDVLNHSFDFVADQMDKVSDMLDADFDDQFVESDTWTARNEAFEAAMHEFGQRNRIGVRDALRDYFNA